MSITYHNHINLVNLSLHDLKIAMTAFLQKHDKNMM